MAKEKIAVNFKNDRDTRLNKRMDKIEGDVEHANQQLNDLTDWLED